MRVCVLCSINKGMVSPIVKSQFDSLKKVGIDVVLFGIKGRGFWGYLCSIRQIYHFLQANKVDVVHAHYSFCGIVASLSTGKPVVCSLMGSDVKQSGLWRFVISLFVKFRWKTTIVKSEEMKENMSGTGLFVIPNGVNLALFKPMDKQQCREKLAWDCKKKYVMFNAAPERFEKNFPIAQEAISLCDGLDVEMKVIINVKQAEIPIYLNASDILLLTSRWEGSPNIVKEAMACNVPVIATEVGDVKWLFGNAKECCLISQPFTSEKIANAIKAVVSQEVKSNARERIIELGIDSESIANKLKQIYECVLKGVDASLIKQKLLDNN